MEQADELSSQNLPSILRRLIAIEKDVAETKGRVSSIKDEVREHVVSYILAEQVKSLRQRRGGARSVLRIDRGR